MDNSLLAELDTLCVVDRTLFSPGKAWKALGGGISFTEAAGNFLAQANLSVNYSSEKI